MNKAKQQSIVPDETLIDKIYLIALIFEYLKQLLAPPQEPPSMIGFRRNAMD